MFLVEGTVGPVWCVGIGQGEEAAEGPRDRDRQRLLKTLGVTE